MSDWGVVDEPRDQGDLERLNDAWNEIAHDASSRPEALDTDDRQTLDRLAMLAGEIKPPPAFVSRLREQLMSTTVLPPSANLNAETILELPSAHAARPRKHIQSWSWTGLASAALILAIVGSLLAIVWNNGGGGSPEPTKFAALGPGASPEASPGAMTEFTPEQLEGMYPLDVIGTAFIDGGVLPRLGVPGPDYKATLFNVKIDPGSANEFNGDADSSVVGYVVDIVVDGTYKATFDGDAIVQHAIVYPNENGMSEIVSAGGTVELQRGDAVIYPYGQKRTVTNPLALTTLRFESIIFTNADVTRVEPNQSGDPMLFEAETAIPAEAFDYGNGGNQDAVQWQVRLERVYPESYNPERLPAVPDNGIVLFDGVNTFFVTKEYRVVLFHGFWG
jgi:hypothetical protein